jgi:gliding motility-associated-like protein
LTVTFTNTTPAASGITYTWDFGQPGTQSQPVANHTYYQSGTYPVTLSATNSNGCSATANASNTITVYDMPQAAFTYNPNPNTFGNSQISFSDNSSGAALWQWNFGDGLGSSNQQNPSYSYPNAGDYTIMLVVTTNNGCKDTAYQNLTVYPLNDIFIPNAFSPNGDGLNDFFGVFGLGLRNVQLSVYNRFGNLVFYGSDVNAKWNGRMKGSGKSCDMGNYTYLIKAIDSFGKSRVLKGTVLLIRE